MTDQFPVTNQSSADIWCGVAGGIFYKIGWGDDPASYILTYVFSAAYFVVITSSVAPVVALSVVREIRTMAMKLIYIMTRLRSHQNNKYCSLLGEIL